MHKGMLARKTIKRYLEGKGSLLGTKLVSLVSVINVILPLLRKARVQSKVTLSPDGILMSFSLEN